MKIDLHCHTHYSYDALSSPHTLIKKASQRGLDGIAVTDHDNCNAWEEAIKAGKELNMKIILGEEITSNRGDILGLFLQKEIQMKYGEPLDIIKEIHKQGGLAIIPHPFHIPEHFRDSLEKYIGVIDGIEVFNARRPFSYADKKALNFARKHNLITTAGSDCHIHFACGDAYAECGANSLEEFKQKLLNRDVITKGKKSSILTLFAPALRKLGSKKNEA